MRRELILTVVRHDCCWFRRNQLQPGVRACPTLPGTFHLTSPQSRAQPSLPPQSQQEMGREESHQWSAGGRGNRICKMQEEGREEGLEASKDGGNVHVLGHRCLSQGTGPTAPSPHPSSPRPFNTEPIKLLSWSEVLLHLEIVAEVGLRLVEVTFHCYLSLVGTETSSL